MTDSLAVLEARYHAFASVGLPDAVSVIEIIGRVREAEAQRDRAVAALREFSDEYGQDPAPGASRKETKEAWRRACAALAELEES